MFVRNKTRWSWLSHLFSSQLCRVFLFLFLTTSTSANERVPAAQVKPKKPITSYVAPTPTPTPTPDLESEKITPANKKTIPNQDVLNNSLNLARDRNSLIDVTAFKKPNPETDWNDFFRNTHASYYISIMGPRIAGSGTETYNVFLNDFSPIQLFHAWQLGFQVNPDLQLGFKLSGTQNIADGVIGRTGIVYQRNFNLFDVLLYANLPNLLKVKGWNVFSSLTMSISSSSGSRDIGKITGLELSQSWSVNNSPSDWTFGFSLYANPQFYTDPIPSGYNFRQLLNANIGHLVSYRVSEIFKIQSTSTFDFEYRSGNLGIGSGLEDRSRLSFTIFPKLNSSAFLSLGGYFQFLVWKPSTETSIIGADLSIGF